MSPSIQIAADWPINSITTIQQCNEAEVFLTQAIANIDGQIANPVTQDPEWARRAHFALKMKRLALQTVQRKRGELNLSDRRAQALRFERTFVNTVRITHPDVYRETVEVIS